MNAKVSVSLVCLAVALVATGCGIGDSQQHLRTAVDARREDLNRCYGETLTRDGNAAGEMHLWVHVESDEGRVDGVEVERSDIQDESLGTCVSSTLQGIQLSEAPSAALRVEYTLLFQPEGGVQSAPTSAPPPPARGL